MKQEYYSIKNLMEIFAVKRPETIIKRIKSGQLEAIKIGKEYRIHRNAIKQFHRDNIIVKNK